MLDHSNIIRLSVIKILISLILVLLGWLHETNAQSILDLPIDSTFEGRTLTNGLRGIANQPNCNIYFLSEWTDAILFERAHIGKMLSTVLDDMFADTDLSYIEMYPNIVVLVKDPSNILARRETMTKALAEGKKVEQIQIGQLEEHQDRKIVINGKVMDWNANEPIVAADIAVNAGEYVVSTDQYGNYELSLVPGIYILSISFLGYQDKVINLSVYDDGELNIDLDQETTDLEEVVIQARQSVDMSTSEIGKTVLDLLELKRAPALLGAPDIIKQIQSLAGVTSVGEATSGFNVRGGSVDQNLILYDGMPQFNSSHAIGFLNGFNYDAIQNVTFYKGGISARYGGRASSVLDIKSLDGNMKSWKGKAGIGLLTSNIMANGPIRKNVSSLTLAMRATYSNWLVRSIDSDFADLSNSTVSFWDGNAKYVHQIDEGSKISVSGYGSFDRFGITVDTTYQWNNYQLSSIWEKQINDNLKGTYELGVSRYSYEVLNKNLLTASKLAYSVSTISGKVEFLNKQKKHKLNYGIQTYLYLFNPGRLSPTTAHSNSADLQLDQ